MNDLSYLKLLNSSGTYDEYDLTGKHNQSLRIFYVNGTSGSDDNDGLTLDTSFKTIQHAIDRCPPGWSLTYEDVDDIQITSHQIYIGEGTYNENITIRNCISIDFYGISDSSGNRPTICIGPQDGSDYAIEVTNHGRAVFKNIEYLYLYGIRGVHADTEGYVEFDSSIYDVSVQGRGKSNIGFYAGTRGTIYAKSTLIGANFSNSTNTSTEVAYLFQIDTGGCLQIDGSELGFDYPNFDYPNDDGIYLGGAYFVSNMKTISAVYVGLGGRACVINTTVDAIIEYAYTNYYSFRARGGLIHLYNITNNGDTFRYADRGGQILSGSQSF